MTAPTQPTAEILRMLINENGVWNERREWITFRQLMLSLIISHFSAHNIEKVKFNRLLSKVILIQTSKPSKEKLASIFGPIVETWGSSAWEQPNCEDARVFTSRNGDSLIDASVNIFEKAE